MEVLLILLVIFIILPIAATILYMIVGIVSNDKNINRNAIIAFIVLIILTIILL